MASLVVGVALVACDSSVPVAPESALQLPRLGPPAAIQPAPAPGPPSLMVVHLSNVNSCMVHLNPSRTTRSSTRLTLPSDGRSVSAGTVLSRIQFLRWDGVSKQPTALIDCVVPRDSASVAAVKEYILRGDGARIGRRVADESTPLNGMMANTFYDGMTCWFDHGFNQFDCDGVQCTYGGHAMRVGASIESGAIADTLRLVSIGDPSGQYMCDNGCTLWADGMGGVGYHCPEDEGDGDEPGGGGGGPGSGNPPLDTASIHLTCSESTPVRGSYVTCTVANQSTTGSTFAVTLWIFEPDDTSLGAVTLQEPGVEWEGVVAASGKVIVEAVSAGAPLADTVAIQVTARQGFGSDQIPIEIPTPVVLSANDVSAFEQLGNVGFAATGNGLYVTISGGPNDGYIYLSGPPRIVATISIASNAMVTGAPFHDRHPLLSGSGTCTRPYIRNTLPNLILAHEGANLESGSHTQRYSASLHQNAQQFRSLAEAIVMGGGGSDEAIETQMSQVTDPAFQAALEADLPANRPTIPCQLYGAQGALVQP